MSAVVIVQLSTFSHTIRGAGGRPMCRVCHCVRSRANTPRTKPPLSRFLCYSVCNSESDALPTTHQYTHTRTHIYASGSIPSTCYTEKISNSTSASAIKREIFRFVTVRRLCRCRALVLPSRVYSVVCWCVRVLARLAFVLCVG